MKKLLIIVFLGLSVAVKADPVLGKRLSTFAGSEVMNLSTAIPTVKLSSWYITIWSEGWVEFNIGREVQEIFYHITMTQGDEDNFTILLHDGSVLRIINDGYSTPYMLLYIKSIGHTLKFVIKTLN